MNVGSSTVTREISRQDCRYYYTAVDFRSCHEVSCDTEEAKTVAAFTWHMIQFVRCHVMM
jgi:hypothetical protein